MDVSAYLAGLAHPEPSSQDDETETPVPAAPETSSLSERDRQALDSPPDAVPEDMVVAASVADSTSAQETAQPQTASLPNDPFLLAQHRRWMA